MFVKKPAHLLTVHATEYRNVCKLSKNKNKITKQCTDFQLFCVEMNTIKPKVAETGKKTVSLALVLTGLNHGLTFGRNVTGEISNA